MTKKQKDERDKIQIPPPSHGGGRVHLDSLVGAIDHQMWIENHRNLLKFDQN